MLCSQCPRKCGVERSWEIGFCGAPAEFRIARIARHRWEEPCLCTGGGSGTVFFCGCNLRCVFCQNRDISHSAQAGRAVSEQELISQLLRLQNEGACNINLVTPTPYAQALIPVLREARPLLNIPIVYNCGGYESVETLKQLEGLIDIYLPDCKYYSSLLSLRYSAAPDYFTVAVQALREMLRQTGPAEQAPDGALRRGVMVRHLVLPGCRKDSMQLLEALWQTFGSSAFLLSLMNQYTPAFASADADSDLHRRLTTFEYESVRKLAQSLGFSGYSQGRSSAGAAYTPDFRDATF